MWVGTFLPPQRWVPCSTLSVGWSSCSFVAYSSSIFGNPFVLFGSWLAWGPPSFSACPIVLLVLGFIWGKHPPPWKWVLPGIAHKSRRLAWLKQSFLLDIHGSKKYWKNNRVVAMVNHKNNKFMHATIVKMPKLSQLFVLVTSLWTTTHYCL